MKIFFRIYGPDIRIKSHQQHDAYKDHIQFQIVNQIGF